MMLYPHLWPDTAAIGPDGQLQIGGCDLTALAATHGTPLYLLDEATLRGTMRRYRAAFAQAYGNTAIHYASKALLNTAVAQIVAQEGLDLDVVSAGELFVAQRANVPMERVHMHGNAKTHAELERAVAWRVGAVVVDNLDELDALAALTEALDRPQAILLRLAPGIDAHTHAHIATGSADSKFGLPLAALDAAAARILAAPGLHLLGLHAHIGSQIFDYAALQRNIAVLLACAARLRDNHGITVEQISPGGGLGVPYLPQDSAPDIGVYAAALGAALRAGCQRHALPLPRLTVEPGRSIVARAGVALYRVVGTKTLDPTTVGAGQASGYIHVDGGMADNIRPSLYGAHYTALLANRANAPASATLHVAGRYCESGDVMLRDAALPQALPGDLLAIAVAGAYTLSMASNYNLVPRPELLLVNEGHARIIQRREREDELVARDLSI